MSEYIAKVELALEQLHNLSITCHVQILHFIIVDLATSESCVCSRRDDHNVKLVDFLQCLVRMPLYLLLEIFRNQDFSRTVPLLRANSSWISISLRHLLSCKGNEDFYEQVGSQNQEHINDE